MSKYEGLTHRLKTEKLSEITLTFAEIEAVTDAHLPKSAQRPQFWANARKAVHIRGPNKAARKAGFLSFLLAGQNKVRFLREQ